ncbi:MAG TPA: nucleoside triphosphate hydrolase [Actinomycetales bacterium]|nr:nucleoside triphosphate hydrolase [Actinomycetales bacterium]
MARIRRHGDWESAQTHSSLLPYLVEETWELIDAVADADRDELVSELGDLLLQVLFHAAIGAERDPDDPAGAPFDIDDIAQAMLDKLRRRAPYWFADDAASSDGAASSEGTGARAVGPRAAGLSAAEQDRLWQEAKAAERAGRPPRGVVDGISWDMPALALGQKVLARAASAGVPDDLVPAEMRTVHVDPIGAYHESETGSAEVAYRQAVRRFADRVRAAEARLGGPGAGLGSGPDADAAAWRAAWD